MSSEFPTRSDTNQAIMAQRKDRGYGVETHLRDIFECLPISFQMKNNDDMRL